MKKIILIFLLSFTFFSSTFASENKSICGQESNEFVVWGDKFLNTQYGNTCNESLAIGGYGFILGKLGNGEHSIYYEPNSIIWDGKVIKTLEKYNQPIIRGISKNGKHYMYDLNGSSTGTYIDNVKIYSDIETKDIHNFRFYFGSFVNDLDGNKIENARTNLFPLSTKEQAKLDSFISTISKTKREILLPKLQTYYKETAKNYKKRIAIYYIYAELTIQKLKENPI